MWARNSRAPNLLLQCEHFRRSFLRPDPSLRGTLQCDTNQELIPALLSFDGLASLLVQFVNAGLAFHRCQRRQMAELDRSAVWAGMPGVPEISIAKNVLCQKDQYSRVLLGLLEHHPPQRDLAFVVPRLHRLHELWRLVAVLLDRASGDI